MVEWIWQRLPLPVLTQALRHTFRSAGLIDYFDVLAVTAVLYLVFRWIHRARAMRVLQGFLIMGLFYLLARHAGLTLTTSVFRGILTVAMVSLASLFQEDLRRFSERITVYRHDPIQRRILVALTRSIRHFSKHHIGALIVLKGKDPLNRHLSGGQALHGRVSSALLESLFDPHSAGHDGAVIIDGTEVTHFGVHLPLSKRMDPESGLGTRHAAALGLAETSDALCLVVSETRGSVMTARGGRLVNLGNGRRLESQLSKFLQETLARQNGGRPWQLLWNHPLEKTGSLALGLALWLVFVKGVWPGERVCLSPVQVMKIPAGFTLGSIEPAQAEVTLRGLEKDLHALPQDTRVILEVPKSPRRLQHLPLSPNLVKAPENVIVKAVYPASVTLRLTPLKPTKPAPARRVWFKLR